MNFLYEAVDETGLPVFGKIDAASETEAERQLQQRGLRTQSLAPSAANRQGDRAAGRQGEAEINRTLTLEAQQAGSSAPPVFSVADRLNTNPEMQELTGVGTMAAPPRAARLSVTAASAPVAQQNGRVANITLAGNAARVRTQTAPARTGLPALNNAAPSAPGVSALGGVKTRDMLFFFRQFSSLTHSGITLYGALENLAARTPNQNLARTAREMSEVARNGGMISDVMARYPAIYPDHVTGMMRAGETGGFVDMALTEIADGYDANIKLYRAAWIPKTMALQAFLMLPIVIPLFPILFRSFDWQANLVAYFKVLMFVSLPISGLLLCLTVYAARTLQLPKYRYLRDSWSLKIPALGNLQREVAIRTFLRMLRRLYHAGIMPIHAWEGAMNTASNVVIRDQLARSYELMQSGSPLSDAFASTGLFADQVEQMVFTGQQSGQVVEMLDQATAYYEQRAEEATGKARFMMLRIGILAMLIFGGAAVCWMAHSYFAAIFHLASPENMGE